jgi:hypothetical protein
LSLWAGRLRPPRRPGSSATDKAKHTTPPPGQLVKGRLATTLTDDGRGRVGWRARRRRRGPGRHRTRGAWAGRGERSSYRSRPLRQLRVRYRYDTQEQAQAIPRHLRRPVTLGGPPPAPKYLHAPARVKGALTGDPFGANP